MNYSVQYFAYFYFWRSKKLCKNRWESDYNNIFNWWKKHKCSDKRRKEQKEDEEDEQPDKVVIPSIQQALDATKLLEKYLLFNEDDPKLSQNLEQIHKIYKTNIGKINKFKQSLRTILNNCIKYNI